MILKDHKDDSYTSACKTLWLLISALSYVSLLLLLP
jgi:hypothetical protein